MKENNISNNKEENNNIKNNISNSNVKNDSKDEESNNLSIRKMTEMMKTADYYKMF